MFLPDIPIIQPVYQKSGFTLLQCDVIDGLNSLAENSVTGMCLSTPYNYMVDYGEEGQHGLEPTLAAFLETQVQVAIAARRPLIEGGIMAVVLGDSTNNYSPARGKQHQRKTGEWVGRRPLEPKYWLESEDKAVPWRYAIEVNAMAGFRYLGYRLWDKVGGGNRKTMMGYCDGEPILFFVKQSKGTRLKPKYFKPFDSMFLKHRPTSDKIHRCPYPESLAKEILEHIADPAHTVDAGSRLVVDFYCGTNTTGLSAYALGMPSIGIDLNCQRAIDLVEQRLAQAKQPVQMTLVPDPVPVPVPAAKTPDSPGIPRQFETVAKTDLAGGRFPPSGWITTDNRKRKNGTVRTTYYYSWEVAGGTAGSIKLQTEAQVKDVRLMIAKRHTVGQIRAFINDNH